MASAIVDFAALLHTSTMILVISRFLFLLIQSRGVTKIAMGIAVLFLALFSFIYFGDFYKFKF